MKKNIHINSLAAFRDDGKELSQREIDIVLFLLTHPGKYTDRQLAAKMGFTHRSMVQPRVSELINNGGIVEEAGSTKCDVTGKTVRQVSLSDGAFNALPASMRNSKPAAAKKPPATAKASETPDLF